MSYSMYFSGFYLNDNDENIVQFIGEFYGNFDFYSCRNTCSQGKEGYSFDVKRTVPLKLK